MLNRALRIVLATAMVSSAVVSPASAQFGFKKAFRAVTKPIVRAPLRAPLGVPLPLPGAGAVLPMMVFGGPFRGVLGVVAAVAVGSIILERLSKNERKEVARRAKVVVAKDPDKRVQDVYTSSDGTKQVTIVAEPMQKASDLKNDPAIQLTADKVVKPDGAPTPAGGTEVASDTSKKTDASAVASTPPAAGTPAADKSQTTAATTPTAPATKPAKDEEIVMINDIPPETQCRKVITELEIKKKKGEVEKNSNTAIFCQTAPGEWKPAAT